MKKRTLIFLCGLLFMSAGAQPPGLHLAAIDQTITHGTWQTWHPNGSPRDSGTFRKGLPDGVWKHWDDQGQLLVFRTYSADKYQRVKLAMLRYHPRRATYPLAKMYADNREAALYHLRAESSFDTQGKTGAANSSDINVGDKNYKPVFNRSLHHGLYMNFYPGNTLKDSGYYQDGLRHGIWKTVSENGNTETGAYRHGVKVKEWKVFSPTGKLLEMIVYTNTGKIRKHRYFN